MKLGVMCEVVSCTYIHLALQHHGFALEPSREDIGRDQFFAERPQLPPRGDIVHKRSFAERPQLEHHSQVQHSFCVSSRSLAVYIRVAEPPTRSGWHAQGELGHQ